MIGDAVKEKKNLVVRRTTTIKIFSTRYKPDNKP